MRGQISQGLLLPLDALGLSAADTPLHTDLTSRLGVIKYVKEIPESMIAVMRGYLPSRVPSTDQERIQNLAEELLGWQAEAGEWEVSEKLEGESCTFAFTEGEFHVCSRQVSFLPSAEVPHNQVAARLGIGAKLASLGEELALQGELVGSGIEGNIYALTAREHRFFLYDVYHIQEGRYLRPEERVRLAAQLGVEHVPIIEPRFVLDRTQGMPELLALADGVSQLRANHAREGLVFKSLQREISFKVISNKYLLRQKT
jgi:RNA ligase (TIGR02306 family)